MMKTLNNLTDLRESGFGRPPPRHGLNLLWWFAQDCVRIDSDGQMIARCDPENGAFGFQRFDNICNHLPFCYETLYYEVGSLHSTKSLPDYVTAHYRGRSDESNTDRLIVSYNSSSNVFDRIYVRRHAGAMYCISVDLLEEIKRLNRDRFLREMMNAPSSRRPRNVCIYTVFAVVIFAFLLYAFTSKH